MEHKDIIWDLTKKWNDEYKDLAVKITKQKGFKRLYRSSHEFIKFANEYFKIFQKKLATKELNSLNHLFEQMEDIISSKAAKYHIVEDFLFEFHDEFKKEFTNELELKQ
ncbi:hypothetical protein C4M96_03830 [Mycoplasmopsis pullorum]|uniref:hypothetical protein n=1 Tax=Mycoplasmopsis pullorum TaxID=48003 RepID=UPI001119EF28|nr:hypothetical protein [Mycoplasmopsis pullorum]TNK81851.1 hypothetical protein C4M93_04185 [Mycoplasmopsis pullorum]TNK91653.1 hypothetical protein C4M96_03830 [Mycoplasmopsis pullorum]